MFPKSFLFGSLYGVLGSVGVVLLVVGVTVKVYMPNFIDQELKDVIIPFSE